MSEARRHTPSTWTCATIENLTEFVTSGSRGWAGHYSKTGPLFFRVGDLQHANIGIHLQDAAHVAPPEGAEGERTRVQPGDVLLSITADVGMIGLVRSNTGEAYVNQHLALLRPSPPVYPEGFAYSLLDPTGFQALVRKAQYGATKAGLSLIQVRAFEVALPPVDEQKRIVEALESYLPRLDHVVATLERVQRNLKRYRGSVLKAAVEGRLVPTEAEVARKEKRSYEPADALLARILHERRRRWEEAELAKLKAAGKAPRDDTWKARYEEPTPPDTSKLPELPEGWCWASAASFFWDAGYGTSEKCTPEGAGSPVLRIPNVQAGRIALEDLKYAGPDSGLKPDGEVRPGDFLFIRTNGSRSLIGRGALVLRRHDPALHFASYLIRLRLAEVDDVAPWFALAWHGPSVRNQLLKVAASSAGQHNVSLSSASVFAIPLPPTSEQTEIVSEVERLESAASAVEEQVSKDVSRCRRLRQSVLKWAFEGKLVDQDPTDEPAETLLARIRAERAAAPTPRTRGRKAKATA